MSWMVIGDGCSQDTVGNCKGVINVTCYKCIPHFSKVRFYYAIMQIFITKALSTCIYLITIYI